MLPRHCTKCATATQVPASCCSHTAVPAATHYTQAVANQVMAFKRNQIVPFDSLPPVPGSVVYVEELDEDVEDVLSTLAHVGDGFHRPNQRPSVIERQSATFYSATGNFSFKCVCAWRMLHASWHSLQPPSHPTLHLPHGVSASLPEWSVSHVWLASLRCWLCGDLKCWQPVRHVRAHTPRPCMMPIQDSGQAFHALL